LGSAELADLADGWAILGVAPIEPESLGLPPGRE
jgi:hypothetical protein